MQGIHEINFEKDLFEISLENSVEYEKQFLLLNNAGVIKVEYCEHKQRIVRTDLEQSAGAPIQNICR